MVTSTYRIPAPFAFVFDFFCLHHLGCSFQVYQHPTPSSGNTKHARTCTHIHTTTISSSLRQAILTVGGWSSVWRTKSAVFSLSCTYPSQSTYTPICLAFYRTAINMRCVSLECPLPPCIWGQPCIATKNTLERRGRSGVRRGEVPYFVYLRLVSVIAPTAWCWGVRYAVWVFGTILSRNVRFLWFSSKGGLRGDSSIISGFSKPTAKMYDVLRTRWVLSVILAVTTW